MRIVTDLSFQRQSGLALSDEELREINAFLDRKGDNSEFIEGEWEDVFSVLKQLCTAAGDAEGGSFIAELRIEPSNDR